LGGDSPNSSNKKELDVELTDVRLVDAGNLELKTGPRFRLTYRNKGTVEVPKFNVTVAVDASMNLTEMAETVTVETVGLKPGKSQTVDVRLPVEVLNMTVGQDGKAAPFALLVAMLDSDESLDETDEENNVLVFARDEIKSIEKRGIVTR
jgi:subtilase family serine protease